MTDYYVDPIGGNNVNNGTTFALRKKTLESLSGIAIAGDTVRVCATHEPITNIAAGAAIITQTDYLSAGNMGCARVFVGHQLNSIVYTPYNGTVEGSNATFAYTPKVDGITTVTDYASTAISTMPQTANTKLGVWDLFSSQNYSTYTKFRIWIGWGNTSLLFSQTSPARIDNNCFRLKLCSDALGDVAVEDWEIKFANPGAASGAWLTFTGTGASNALPSSVRSVALYTGTNWPGVSTTLYVWGAYVLTAANVVAPGDFISPKDAGANRSRWDRAAYVLNGTTTSGRLYPAKNSNADHKTDAGNVAWEVMRPITWFTMSDYVDLAFYELAGWQISNMAASFDNVSIIGGHSPTDGSPDWGYTIFDFGLRNQDYGYAMRCDTARTLVFKRFVSCGGASYGGFVNYPSTINTPVTVNWEDCHVLDGQGININLRVGGSAGSVFKNCSWTGELNNHGWYTCGDGGSILFDRCKWYRMYGITYYIVDSMATFKNCEWESMDAILIDYITPYTGGITFEGTNSARWASYFDFRDTTQHASEKIYSGLILRSCGLRVTGGRNITVDGLVFTAGTAPYTVAADLRVYQNADVNKQSVIGENGPITFKNCIFDQISAINAMAHAVFESCTVYLAFTSSSDPSSFSGHFVFRNCTVGRKLDTLNSVWMVRQQDLQFYNCTINRIEFRAAAELTRITVVGGSITGTAHVPFGYASVGAETNALPTMWRFHNVNFPSYNFETALATQFQTRLFQAYNYLPALQNFIFSGCNNNPTQCLIQNSFWRMISSTTIVHSAGGRSWFVDFFRETRESYPRHDNARVAVRANTQVNISMWVYCVTSGCTAYLKAEPAQVGTNQIAIRMFSTGVVGAWEQITYQFTPNADGVIDFNLSFSALDGTRSLYIDDITFDQT